jgi:hypothetical protein
MLGTRQDKQHDNLFHVDFMQTLDMARTIYENMEQSGQVAVHTFATVFRKRVKAVATTDKTSNAAAVSCITSLAKQPKHLWDKIHKIIHGLYEYPTDARGNVIRPRMRFSRGRDPQDAPRRVRKVRQAILGLAVMICCSFVLCCVDACTPVDVMWLL